MAAQVNSSSQLDALIQQATSEHIPNGEIDLALSLEISDVIRSRRVPPKDSMRCLKRRIIATRSNPNSNLSSWRLAEVCVKNGGIPFIKEVCSREFMDCLEYAILENDSNEDIESVCTNMLQNLYVAFKNDSQLNYVSKVYQRLVTRGVEFPQETSVPSESATAMFDSKTPADWIDSDACMICSNKFSLLNRKHHCRSCGGIFCQEHSSHTIPLPDLGIYEPVRVCDNCYDDYDLKRQSGKKHRRKRKGHKGSTETEEDEDLKRAIELSLRESRHQDTAVPVVPVVDKQNSAANEEEDADLKAAIEASLREAAEEKKRRESAAHQPAMDYQVPAIRSPQSPNELTTAEEDDIQLFASLVERMKSQPVTAVLEDPQLQQLYRKVIRTGPKLNVALNETVTKYNTLLQMNGKISDIMNIYDSLLEKQLRDINLSQQYSVPQLPSDPYAYYNVAQAKTQEQQAYPSPHQPQAYAPQPQDSQQLPVYQNQQYNPQQFASHKSNQRIETQPYAPSSQQLSSRSQAQEYSQAEQSQSYHSQQYPSNKEMHSQFPLNQQSLVSPPINHSEQLQNLAFSSGLSQANSHPSITPYPQEEQRPAEVLSVPSEPPYPQDREENISAELPSDPPYPTDDVHRAENNNGDKSKNGITNFDFPTVPVQKPSLDGEISEETQQEVESDEPEELLIEL